MNILFVDDEPMALRALQRTLSTFQSGWKLQFRESASEALKLLSEEPFDVVVTDMRMPKDDGAEFLAEVRVQHPLAVRMVLSGFKDEQAAIRSTDSAHRFLAKPIMSQDLVDEIVSVSAALPAKPSLRQIVLETSSLPSPYLVVDELHAALSRTDVSEGEIAAIVQLDPALSAKILQITASSFFSRVRGEIDLARCVRAIGPSMLRLLAERKDFISAIREDDPRFERIDAIANRGRQTAIERTSTMSFHSKSENEYLGGLLHVVGELLCEGLQTGIEIDIPPQSEAFRLGVSLLRLWGLPKAIIDVVKQHDEEPQR